MLRFRATVLARGQVKAAAGTCFQGLCSRLGFREEVLLLSKLGEGTLGILMGAVVGI